MTSLLLGIQLSIFGLQAAEEVDAAAAVAVGLARAESACMEAPVTLEVAKAKPSARVDGTETKTGTIEWVPTCDQYGCRLVPRLSSPDAAGLPAAEGPVAGPVSSKRSDEGVVSSAEGWRCRSKRGLFGRRR